MGRPCMPKRQGSKEEKMIIETSCGKMTGVDHGDYMEYRKVPYAKPPVGNRRFKAPERPDAWDGVYEAIAYANKCMQKGNHAEPYGKDLDQTGFERAMDEDCLYLNIWMPKNTDGSNPVAVWIHGGAFLGGYATEMEFDGAEYCRRGVILASVEYRCNIFGFLAHPWLSAEDPNGRSGNYGILDQIAAIEWIYENANAFGGDPDNITIFGQSAGAMSVQTLCSSERVKGKVAKAIMQSGGSYGLGLHRDIPQTEQESYGQVFTNEILKVNSLEELRAVSQEKLLEGMDPFLGRMMPVTHGLFLTPTMDGYVLDDSYYKIMDDNRLLDIPYMVGWNDNDLDIQEPGGPKDGKETFLCQGSKNFAGKMEELGRQPAYLYKFARKLPGDDWGAYHSAELFYMFGTLDRCWRPWEEHDRALSAEMLDAWTSFMKTGNPGKSWKPYRKDDEYIKVFE